MVATAGRRVQGPIPALVRPSAGAFIVNRGAEKGERWPKARLAPSGSAGVTALPPFTHATHRQYTAFKCMSSYAFGRWSPRQAGGALCRPVSARLPVSQWGRGVSDPARGARTWPRARPRGRSRLACRCRCGSRARLGWQPNRARRSAGDRARFSRREVRSSPWSEPAPFCPRAPVHSNVQCRRSEPAFCGSEGTCQGYPHCVRRCAALTRALALPIILATIGASAE
jgi:hypothetical protein